MDHWQRCVEAMEKWWRDTKRLPIIKSSILSMVHSNDIHEVVKSKNCAISLGGVIPRLDLAYETWGELNHQRSNAILLFTGLSASSHARSTEVGITV